MNLYKILTTFMLSVVVSFFVPNIYASEQILVEGGVFEMGSHYCEEEQNNSDWCNDETPHKVQVDSFWVDKFEVTNYQYFQFVKETGYITTAEKSIDWDELKKQLPSNSFKPVSYTHLTLPTKRIV